MSECIGCPPCPGRGNDGHGLSHCAECCFGTGVDAEYGCPVHNPVSRVQAVEAAEDHADQTAFDAWRERGL